MASLKANGVPKANCIPKGDHDPESKLVCQILIENKRQMAIQTLMAVQRVIESQKATGYPNENDLHKYKRVTKANIETKH